MQVALQGTYMALLNGTPGQLHTCTMPEVSDLRLTRMVLLKEPEQHGQHHLDAYATAAYVSICNCSTRHPYLIHLCSGFFLLHQAKVQVRGNVSGPKRQVRTRLEGLINQSNTLLANL
jgi:hypothetical protein